MPIGELHVIKYEDKVYGYIRYCALPSPDQGTVIVKLINEWTNGHNFLKGRTLCSSHGWYTNDQKPVLTVTHKVGVDGRHNRVLTDEFKIRKTDFDRVARWYWKFERCHKRAICINSTACEKSYFYPNVPQ
jgi:hypothetical protein